jgi:peptidoglycan/LPS O-acetylase OafA/YrhL
MQGGADATVHLDALQRFITEGRLAVSFLFVLSGFILAYTYSTDGETLRGNSREFWFARFSRLWPMYMVGMALDAPFVLENFARYPHGIFIFFAGKLAIGVLTAAMLQSWIAPIVAAWNAPGWSLSVEAFFYAMFPTLLLAFSRLSSRRMLLALIPLWLLSLPSTYFVTSCFPPLNEPPPIFQLSSIWLAVGSNLPLFRLPEFAIGMLLGMLFIRHRTLLSSGAFPVLLPIFGAIILLAGVALTKPSIATIVAIPAFAMLIFGAALQRGPMYKILSFTPLVLLGESSYCLYIIHWPVGKIFYALEHGFAAGTPVSYQEHFLPYFAIVTTLSVFLYRRVERPICTWLRRRPTVCSWTAPRDASSEAT